MSKPEPLDNYTTAQQLGAIRRELIAEGFTKEQAADIAAMAFRHEVGFVVRLHDISGLPTTDMTLFGVRARLVWLDGPPLDMSRDDLAAKMNQIASALLAEETSGNA